MLLNFLQYMRDGWFDPFFFHCCCFSFFFFDQEGVVETTLLDILYFFFFALFFHFPFVVLFDTTHIYWIIFFTRALQKKATMIMSFDHKNADITHIYIYKDRQKNFSLFHFFFRRSIKYPVFARKGKKIFTLSY